MLKVGIVANEPSGDTLGAGLMKALHDKQPNIAFYGVGGVQMERLGMISLYPLERLSVMGLIEVLKHLPELHAIRRGLKRHFLKNPPDVFIGVDAPDFNLDLERWLKNKGIPTVHYVSPTVWAWRPKRVRKIRAAVDLMLSIFPFETDFLKQHRVPVTYIGHPLADEIPLNVDPKAARRRLGLTTDVKSIAILPGSRVSEVEALADVFLQTAHLCAQQRPGLRFLVPLVNERTRNIFETACRRAPRLPGLQILEGQSRDAMLAADAVLTASGTATLEGALLKAPMVVSYRLSPLTYWIVKTFDLVKVPYIAMANLLAGEEIAPEFIQDRARPDLLSEALIEILDSPERVAKIRSTCLDLHKALRLGAADQAAAAVLALAESRR